jgi:hypothetical protein
MCVFHAPSITPWTNTSTPSPTSSIAASASSISSAESPRALRNRLKLAGRHRFRRDRPIVPISVHEPRALRLCRLTRPFNLQPAVTAIRGDWALFGFRDHSPCPPLTGRGITLHVIAKKMPGTNVPGKFNREALRPERGRRTLKRVLCPWGDIGPQKEPFFRALHPKTQISNRS